MPMYDFHCNDCGHVFTLEMRVAGIHLPDNQVAHHQQTGHHDNQKSAAQSASRKNTVPLFPATPLSQ